MPTRCTNCFAKQFNFLESLTEKEKEQFQKNSSPMTLKKGDVVFFEDDVLQHLYCIKSGACKFSKSIGKNDEYITDLLGKGDVMGRRSIITQKGAMVTATALEDTTLCCIDKTPVVHSIKTNNDFCIDILKGFINDTKLDFERTQYYNNHSSVKKRLAGLLLYLQNKFGVDTDGWLNISLKRDDMANILGTTSEYVISLLSHFKEKNYLNSKRGKLKLISINALQSL
jgi:CRP-like cAMP-binding protein